VMKAHSPLAFPCLYLQRQDSSSGPASSYKPPTPPKNAALDPSLFLFPCHWVPPCFAILALFRSPVRPPCPAHPLHAVSPISLRNVQTKMERHVTSAFSSGLMPRLLRWSLWRSPLQWPPQLLRRGWPSRARPACTWPNIYPPWVSHPRLTQKQR
jgi:hypothetical protein